MKLRKLMYAENPNELKLLAPAGIPLAAHFAVVRSMNARFSAKLRNGVAVIWIPLVTVYGQWLGLISKLVYLKEPVGKKSIIDKIDLEIKPEAVAITSVCNVVPTSYPEYAKTRQAGNSSLHFSSKFLRKLTERKSSLLVEHNGPHWYLWHQKSENGCLRDTSKCCHLSSSILTWQNLYFWKGRAY